MVGLAETISRMAQLRGKFAQPGMGTVEDRLSDIDDFGPNPGALRARTYIPEHLPAGAPLVVVLHGCTQTAAGYDTGSGWSMLADRYGFALLFPEQRRTNNPNLCFNWFLPEHNRRGGGEALSISEMIKTIIARHGIDPSRVFVSGLSAGGAMASVMLATYPEMFAGGAVIAGLPYGVASSVPEALGAMRGHPNINAPDLAAKVRNASPHAGPWPRISVWHGSADLTVAASNGAAIVEQWRELLGLPLRPTRADTVGGIPRRCWLDDDGRELLEEVIVPGMGHGTPIDTSVDGGGSSAAFMLQAGISSTHEICRFWGIGTRGGEAADRPARTTAPAPSSPVGAEPRAQTRRLTPETAAPKAMAQGVEKIITDALRAGGLMR